MYLSAKEQYALQALTELSRVFVRGECATMEQIAERFKIPKKYLVQVLIDLRRSGLVTSKRGLNGGYRLARAPQEVTFGDVSRAVAGDPLVFDHKTREKRESKEQVPDQALRHCWSEVVHSVSDILDKSTFKGVLDRDEGNWELAYNI